MIETNGLHAPPRHAQPVSTKASSPLRWSPTAPVPDHDDDLALAVTGLGRIAFHSNLPWIPASIRVLHRVRARLADRHHNVVGVGLGPRER